MARHVISIAKCTIGEPDSVMYASSNDSLKIMMKFKIIKSSEI